MANTCDEWLVSIEVPTEPVGKGRPRFTKTGRTYTPVKTARFEKLVELEAREAMTGMYLSKAPLHVEITAIFTVPKSESKKKRAAMVSGEVSHTKRPDLDNVVKAVLDALNGVVWVDDCQVVSLAASKEYGFEPLVVVNVYERTVGHDDDE